MLGGDVSPVAERFTSGSPCASCALPLGDAQVSLLFYEAERAAAVRAAHRSCEAPAHHRLTMIPLDPTSQYEFRTISLPVNQDGLNGSLPVLLLRLGVDVVVLFEAPSGEWHPVIDQRLTAGGFTPPSNVLPYAAPPSRCVLVHPEDPLAAPTAVTVHLPGGDAVTVPDQGFAMEVARTGGALVMVMAKGDVKDVSDVPALERLLRDPELRMALVPVERDEPAGAGPAGEASAEPASGSGVAGSAEL